MRARKLTKTARGLVAAALVVTIGIGVGQSAAADDIDDRLAAAQSEAQQRRADRANLEASLDETNAQLRQAALDLDDVKTRLPVAQAELARAQADLQSAQREAELLAQRLQDAQDQEAAVSAQLDEGAGKVEAARADIAQMAREAVRGQGDVSAFGLVTGAQSTKDFLDEYAVSSSAARSQARSLTALQDAEALAQNQEARLAAIQEQITQLKDAADAKLAEARAAAQVAKDREQEVKDLIAKQERLTATISAQRDATMQEIEETKQDVADTEASIKNLTQQKAARDAEIAAQRAKEEAAKPSGGSGGGTSSGGGGSGGGGGATTSGKFLAWPTASTYVTSNFGWRLSPTYGVWMLHAGADFRAPLGAPIRAAQSGEVEYSRCEVAPGCNVRINHGTYQGQNVRTRYLHMADAGRAQVGQWVEQGQIIGYSGGTGRITGPHLHFELYINGTATDPVPWLP
jgi:murein DD-endopeptidase MepM/ murein hydrolase activator NlpD